MASPIHVRLIVAVFMLFSVLAGCDSGGRSSGGGVGEDGGNGDVDGAQDANEPVITPPGPGEIGLTVLDAYEHSRLGELESQSGRRFVLVELHLANGADNEALPVSFLLFSLETSGGIQISASAHSALTDASCAQDISISAGASYECEVAFEVPFEQAPTKLHYSSVDGREASADVNSTPCTQCGSECVDLQSDVNHCGSCGQSVGAAQECVDGEIRCTDTGLTQCGSECVDLDRDPDHCGECFRSTPDHLECSGGELTCRYDEDELCGSECVNLNNDYDHCGSCGNACGSDAMCYDGDCQIRVVSTANESCDTLCANQSHSCISSEALYESSTSSYGLAVELGCHQVAWAERDAQGHRYYFDRMECGCI